MHNEGRRFDVLDVLLQYRYDNDWNALMQAERPQTNEIEPPTQYGENRQLPVQSKAMPLTPGLEQFQLVQFANEIASHAQYPVFSYE